MTTLGLLSEKWENLLVENLAQFRKWSQCISLNRVQLKLQLQAF